MRYDMNGKFLGSIDLPASAPQVDSAVDMTKETFYSFSSFTTPPSIYRVDLKTNERRFFEAEVDFDPEDFVVNQVWYESADGTLVPMFLCYKKGRFVMEPTPRFCTAMASTYPDALLHAHEDHVDGESNIYAVNLRGGGEFGESWHDAGTFSRKQNVFDDFIAAAVRDNKYTSLPILVSRRQQRRPACRYA